MIVSIHVISFVLVLKRLVNKRMNAMFYSLLYNYLITVNQIVGNLSMMVRADTDIDKDYTEFTDYHAHLKLQGQFDLAATTPSFVPVSKFHVHSTLRTTNYA